MLDFGIYNMDCMIGMKEFPDKYFELAIVDPPYFKGVANGDYFHSHVKHNRKHNVGNITHWNNGIPKQDYYNELLRVSKHQIIWGSNYYEFKQPPGTIVWDKEADSSPFSDCELASIDLINSVKIFRYKWNGMIVKDMKNKEQRIHPTQKPVALYAWLLNNYSKPGDKILDTHLGSGSSAIACYDLGFDFTGFEIDKEYFESAQKRINDHKAQISIFTMQEEELAGQVKMEV